LIDDLLQARQELDDLKQRYTDNHPDVITIKARITMLETQLENRTASGVAATAAEDQSLPQVSTYNIALRSELSNVLLTIQRLKDDELRLRQEIERYEDRVESAFSRQQELTQLTRDYENYEEYYQSLLDRQLDSRLSSKVLRTFSENQYEVLDPARLPRHPYDPDPIRIILLAIGCGLGVGVVLAAGLEFRNDAFFSSDVLEECMQYPVLATIPLFADPAAQGQQKRKIVVIVSVVILAILALCFINIFLVDLVAIIRDFLNTVIQ